MLPADSSAPSSQVLAGYLCCCPRCCGYIAMRWLSLGHVPPRHRPPVPELAILSRFHPNYVIIGLIEIGKHEQAIGYRTGKEQFGPILSQSQIEPLISPAVYTPTPTRENRRVGTCHFSRWLLVFILPQWTPSLESSVCEIKFLSPKVRAPPIIKWYLFVVIIDFIKPAMESPLHTRTLTVCLGTPRQKHQKSIIESDDPAQKADLEWQKAQRRKKMVWAWENQLQIQLRVLGSSSDQLLTKLLLWSDLSGSLSPAKLPSASNNLEDDETT